MSKRTSFFFLAAFACFFTTNCKPVVIPVVDAAPEGGTDAGSSDDAALPPSDLDSSRLDDCAKACQNLRSAKIQCKTGVSQANEESCTTSCRHARDSRLMPLDILCAEKAQSLADAHRCAGWGC